MEENKEKLEKLIEEMEEVINRDRENKVSENDAIQMDRIKRVEQLKDELENLNSQQIEENEEKPEEQEIEEIDQADEIEKTEEIDAAEEIEETETENETKNESDLKLNTETDLEQDAILKKIIKDARQFNMEKQILKNQKIKLAEKGLEDKEALEKIELQEQELREKIEEQKNKIIRNLKDKQEDIFENRHEGIEKLRPIDLRRLENEKKALHAEITLANTNEEQFEKMTDKEKQKVEAARENLKSTKGRIKEINEITKMSKILDGKKPIEKFKEMNEIMKNVEEKFNYDKIDEILFDALIQVKNNENEKEGIKPTKETVLPPTPPQTPTRPQTSQQPPQIPPISPQTQQQPQELISPQIQQSPQVPKVNMGKIVILEKEGKVLYDFGDEKGEISLQEINEDKKAMYKRLEIRKRAKGFGTFRKVNPAIIKALDRLYDGDKMIDEYLNSIKNKETFKFKLNHNLTGLNVIQKMRMNRQAKHEQRCGADILGKLFQKNNNKLLENANKTNDIKTPTDIKMTQTPQTPKQTPKDFRKALNPGKESLVNIDKIIAKAQEEMDNINERMDNANQQEIDNELLTDQVMQRKTKRTPTRDEAR